MMRPKIVALSLAAAACLTEAILTLTERKYERIMVDKAKWAPTASKPSK